eukprot:363970-Chlamydomonas_euryale.AAC.6
MAAAVPWWLCPGGGSALVAAVLWWWECSGGGSALVVGVLWWRCPGGGDRVVVPWWRCPRASSQVCSQRCPAHHHPRAPHTRSAPQPAARHRHRRAARCLPRLEQLRRPCKHLQDALVHTPPAWPAGGRKSWTPASHRKAAEAAPRPAALVQTAGRRAAAACPHGRSAAPPAAQPAATRPQRRHASRGHRGPRRLMRSGKGEFGCGDAVAGRNDDGRDGDGDDGDDHGGGGDDDGGGDEAGIWNWCAEVNTVCPLCQLRMRG